MSVAIDAKVSGKDPELSDPEFIAPSLEEEEEEDGSSKKRRGEYSFYPPTLRIRIAKMALEKGVSKTVDHFSDDTGRYVSPSTVASIRNQYLKEVSQCIEEDVVHISELPKADTGRPLLLEELDSHIQQCVGKIRESGGAVNAAVIKRIARDMIIANNKSLLLEYGGPFELSNAWAERTLKRIANGMEDSEPKVRPRRKKMAGRKKKKQTSGLEEIKQAYVEIITTAVTSERVPTDRRRSQRKHVQAATAAADGVDVEAEKSSSDKSKTCEEEVADKDGESTKYRLVACPVTRRKQNSQRRFRILRIPVRNLPRNCNRSRDPDNGKTSGIDNSDGVDIPEEELIEMAIPSMAGKKKRGDYATYTSEQRIKMAKMALESGVAKTAQHFTTELGRYVSPSSIASMRNQYKKESEKSECEVMSLPKGKRGRPLLLGHLDNEIKHAVEAIKNSGAKVGRNIVKSVARDVIMANNRGLLKEYGGPLQLTNTWAESVMKRMGFVKRRRTVIRTAPKGVGSTKKPCAESGTNNFEELNQAYIEVLNNAVSSAVSTHGLGEDLMSSYDQYPNGTHEHLSMNNNYSVPTEAYTSNVQMITGQDAMGLGPLNRTPQMEMFTPGTQFNHGNLYYGNWSGSRDFSQSAVGCGEYHQTGTATGHGSYDLQVMGNGTQSGNMSMLGNSSGYNSTIPVQGIAENMTSVPRVPLSSADHQEVPAPLADAPTEEEGMVKEDVVGNRIPEKGTSIVTSRRKETDVESSIPKQKKPGNRKTKSVRNGKRKRGEYGVYTADQRMKMAKCALEYGVTKAAGLMSEELGRMVSSSTVASMRNLYLREFERTNGEFKELPKGKRGRPLLLGDLDSQIQRCLMNIRVNGGVITRSVVVSVAKGILLAKNKRLLKENAGPVELSTTWAESVIRRMGFVRQKTTEGTVDKSPPTDFENLKSAFLKRITTAIVTKFIPSELVLNFGQTALKIVPSSSWTTEKDHPQLPTVEIEDRREITSLLTVTLSGHLLPLQLIYTGKTEQCHPNVPFPEGWQITHTDNHLCTKETVIQFVERIIIPYVTRTRSSLGLRPDHKALVVFDVINMNQDKEFFTRLRENNIEVVLVPTPCTSLLQPLELVVFGRFRDELYKLFVNWYSAEVCEAVRVGQNPSNVIVDLRLSVLKHLHAQWILKAHELIGGDKLLLVEGFCRAGIRGALEEQRT